MMPLKENDQRPFFSSQENKDITMVLINTNDRKSKRRNLRSFSTCFTLFIVASILTLIFAFVASIQASVQQQQQQRVELNNHNIVAVVPTHSGDSSNNEGAVPIRQDSEPLKNVHAEEVTLKQVEGDNDVSRGVESSATSIRATVLQILESLPNNTTQREFPRAIVPRNKKGVITITTQGGASKLPRLLDLVGRWLGPISFGYYITSAEHLDVLLAFVAENDLIQQYVTFHFLMEQPQLPLTVNRHPINRLRNLALESAETDFVFINDVDFMPPAGAHDAIAPRISELSPKTFLVLPAFERFGTDKRGPGRFVDNVNMIPSNKKELIEAVTKKEVAPFHEYFPPGHGPSDYKKWYTATEMYDIKYDYLFEPYVIVHKEGLPQFFPTFRGFGFNKMCFFMEAFYMGGFSYKVLPDQYVVHMNHGGRKGRNDKGGTSGYIKNDFRAYLTKMYGVTTVELVKWK